MKPVNDQQTPPLPMVPISGAVNYQAIAALPFANAIDAHSSGNGVFPALTNGNVVLQEGWLALTLSVADGVLGRNRSLFRYANDDQRSTGSEIISHYFRGSIDLPDELVGETVVETNATHIGFAPDGGDDVYALDYGMGALHLEQGSTAIFSDALGYFFSVTKEWADTHAGTPFALTDELASVPTLAADGGAIYYLERIGDSWSQPILYISSQELGFAPGEGDVDALEVNWSLGAVIYSGTTESRFDPAAIDGAPNQLMFHQSDNPSGSMPTALKDSEGVTVARRVRVSDDPSRHEIDAVCAIDPESTGQTYRRFAIPRFEAQPGATSMGFSAARYSQSTGDPLERIAFQATGWGGVEPDRCWAELYRSTSGGHAAGQVNVDDASVWTRVRRRARLASQDTTEIILMSDAPLPTTSIPAAYCFVLRDPQTLEILGHSFLAEFIF